jgi:protocatechuate 3,4-dioxygenase beta subunit
MGNKNLSGFVLVMFLILAGCSAKSDSKVPDKPDSIAGCVPTQVSGATSGDGVVFPLRDSLPNIDGASKQVRVSGYVLSKTCLPVADVLVKFWSASKTGEYTEDSYGSIYTDDSGFYSFTAPYPGVYLNSQDSAHIHVSTTVDGFNITTEVFPDKSGLEVVLNLVAGYEPPSQTGELSPDGV